MPYVLSSPLMTPLFIGGDNNNNIIAIIKVIIIKTKKYIIVHCTIIGCNELITDILIAICI